MKITQQEQATDPAYPMMHGTTPVAKEFNKNMEAIWKAGHVQKADFELIHTVLMEILVDDYNRRHAPRKRAKKL